MCILYGCYFMHYVLEDNTQNNNHIEINLQYFLNTNFSNINKKLADGSFSVTWSPDLSTGIYFLRFYIGDVEVCAIEQGAIVSK